MNAKKVPPESPSGRCLWRLDGKTLPYPMALHAPAHLAQRVAGHARQLEGAAVWAGFRVHRSDQSVRCSGEASCGTVSTTMLSPPSRAGDPRELPTRWRRETFGSRPTDEKPRRPGGVYGADRPAIPARALSWSSFIVDNVATRSRRSIACCSGGLSPFGMCRSASRAYCAARRKGAGRWSAIDAMAATSSAGCRWNVSFR